MNPCPVCSKPIALPEMKNIEEQRTICPHCHIPIITPSRKACWEAGERLREETFRQLGIAPPAPFGEETWTEDGLQVRMR